MSLYPCCFLLYHFKRSCDSLFRADPLRHAMSVGPSPGVPGLFTSRFHLCSAQFCFLLRCRLSWRGACGSGRPRISSVLVKSAASLSLRLACWNGVKTSRTSVPPKSRRCDLQVPVASMGMQADGNAVPLHLLRTPRDARYRADLGKHYRSI